MLLEMVAAVVMVVVAAVAMVTAAMVTAVMAALVEVEAMVALEVAEVMVMGTQTGHDSSRCSVAAPDAVSKAAGERRCAGIGEATFGDEARPLSETPGEEFGEEAAYTMRRQRAGPPEGYALIAKRTEGACDPPKQRSSSSSSSKGSTRACLSSHLWDTASFRIHSCRAGCSGQRDLRRWTS